MTTETTETTPITDTTLDDDFQSGFDNAETSTETPRADDDEPQDEASAPAAPEYVQLTRQEVEELKARAALIDEIKATQEKSFGTAFGKLGGLERDLKALKEGKRVEIDQADIDALREDFPPLAAALEKVRDLQIVSGAGIDQDAIGKLVEERAGQKVSEFKQQLESRFLRRVHPDWETYATAPEFTAWVQTQPADFQQQLAKASDEWDSDFIADAMTKAKAAAKAQADANRQVDGDASARRSRMSAAVTPRGSGNAPGPNDDDEFHAGFKTG